MKETLRHREKRGERPTQTRWKLNVMRGPDNQGESISRRKTVSYKDGSATVSEHGIGALSRRKGDVVGGK